ncbi:tRNA (N(6)-L-threonylcarbamoyladenosine(37)-C(2))-methylthiotransferase MtaB [Telmatobacter sp. DSM 110680]|uniref:tRNA (N(6)-L-threonylcarbamoyladenosine(37)-C(2))-methylthiotransferase MtaB n=1 Tax=Telmatobacter sp. DSM 110680 TaxID=3036704 RepID=A0AAU7DRN0_9BACT
MPSLVHIENFGCRAARADGEAIAALLRTAGVHESQTPDADVVIVNTCSVTAEADREARAYIRRAHRLNPTARIIATGCYAQRAPQELAAISGVSAVIGNSHKALAPEIALGLMNADSVSSSNYGLIQIHSAQSGVAPPQVVLADDSFAHSFLEEAPITSGAQTRPNLKIQEGCSNRCSFCVIPQTRGNSRSLSGNSILSHVHNFVASGGNELVLSGINLGRWGRDLDPAQSFPRTFAALVRAIIEQTNLPRLRLSSIEPMDWDADLIAIMSEYGGTHLARHAHLPLQSGSDSVLRRMHRRYRPWHYADKVAALRQAAGPSLTLGADVMVGFPGETDREFQETCDFIRSLPFGYLHLFPFSPRPGTRAWTLHAASPVPQPVAQQRMATLRALAAEKMRAHRRQFIGTELDAITLHTPPELASANCTSALTENFLPVEVAGATPANQLIRLCLTGMGPDATLIATPARPSNYLPNPHLDARSVLPEPTLEIAY